MNRFFDTLRRKNGLKAGRRLALLSLVALLAAGCGGNDEEYDLTRSIEEAYIEADQERLLELSAELAAKGG